MAKESPCLEVPVPSAAGKFTTEDMQSLFADITKMTPRDEPAEKAFLASKLQMVRTHPTLDLATRQTMAAHFAGGLAPQAVGQPTGPVPGGVGYGMFYNGAFKTNWSTGTAIYWEIVCPTPPGGNVNNFLYLTATNRSGKGVRGLHCLQRTEPDLFQDLRLGTLPGGSLADERSLRRTWPATSGRSPPTAILIRCCRC